MSKGKLFVISGASGVGKGTVLKEVIEKRKDLAFSVSATTRPPRPSEQEGVHYYFISEDRFEEMIANDEFVEYDRHNAAIYGTPLGQLEEKLTRGHVILDIEPKGAGIVHGKRPDAILIFIMPPSMEELERRLIGRGTEDMEKVKSRLARGKEEFLVAKDVDYFVINDTVDRAVDEISAIMCAEHCKPDERIEMINR